MSILVIDNYDSFTYNLVQLIGKFNSDIIVARNDAITIEEIENLKPEKILISPGPGRPENCKISLEAIKYFGGKIPILGVCLGHQAIGIAFGAHVSRGKKVMHGKISLIKHDGKNIFKDIPQNFNAMRYHSLVVDRQRFPKELEITAETNDGIIMGLRHNIFPIEGIQFHPESILTTNSEALIKNWLLN